MANIKSQIKRNRQNEKRRLRNKSVKSSLKTAIRKFHERAAAAGDAESAAELMREASASWTRPSARASSTRTRPLTASQRSRSGWLPFPPDHCLAPSRRAPRRVRTRTGPGFHGRTVATARLLWLKAPHRATERRRFPEHPFPRGLSWSPAAAYGDAVGHRGPLELSDCLRPAQYSGDDVVELHHHANRHRHKDDAPPGNELGQRKKHR